MLAFCIIRDDSCTLVQLCTTPLSRCGLTSEGASSFAPCQCSQSMSSNRAALQVLLALAVRLKVGRQTKFLAAAIFTDRCIPVWDKDRPVALPGNGDTLCTLVCLSKAAEMHSKGDCISMADNQTAAAEVLGPAFSSTDLKRVEVWLEPRLSIEELPQLSSDIIEDMLKHLQRTGMQAFAAALADEGLLGLCDTILEALQFCPGFQTSLTCGGSLLAAAVIGAAVLMSGKRCEHHSYPGVLALLADSAGHPKEVVSAQITTIMSSVLLQ